MADDETVPHIILGGRKFAVPEFPVREQRTFVPLVLKCSAIDYSAITEDDMGLLIDLLFRSVSRPKAVNGSAEPAITREDFEELPIKLLTELIPAVGVISKQLGMEPTKKGEQLAGGQPAPGTTSTS